MYELFQGFPDNILSQKKEIQFHLSGDFYPDSIIPLQYWVRIDRIGF